MHWVDGDDWSLYASAKSSQNIQKKKCHHFVPLIFIWLVWYQRSPVDPLDSITRQLELYNMQHDALAPFFKSWTTDTQTWTTVFCCYQQPVFIIMHCYVFLSTETVVVSHTKSWHISDQSGLNFFFFSYYKHVFCVAGRSTWAEQGSRG